VNQATVKMLTCGPSTGKMQTKISGLFLRSSG